MTDAIARVEDPRLLTGAGRYTADLDLPGQAYAAVVRSPHAHAKLVSIDAAAALAGGALAVVTGEDEAKAGWGGVPGMPVKDRRGGTLLVPHYPALAQGKVRFAGQPVALVVAETLASAQDAAELLDIAYEELPSVTDGRAALEPGAPQLHDNVPGNLAVDYGIGDEKAADEAFARAAHVTKLTVVNQRVVVCAMEPRAAIGAYDPAADKYTLHTGTQGATALRDVMAGMMKLPKKEQLRVVTGDVGGGFGMKTPPYPEYLALLLAARKVGRPVKWVGSRGESFLSDSQGRDTVMTGELALDRDGTFLALRIRAICSGGAYLTPPGAHIATANFAVCLINVYATPIIDAQSKYVLTNAVPVGPYRGAGRPEAAYIVERLVDRAARELKIDPASLRRRNLIPVSAMPYKAPNGALYDSGDFAPMLDKALALSDGAGYAARHKESATQGKLRGRGIAMFLEVSGGAPAEFGGIRFVDGVLELYTGGGSSGQSHETVYKNLVAERLGLDPAKVRLVQGDSDRVPRGATSTASRTTIAVGAVTLDSVAKVIEKGRQIAAERLEASLADIEYAAGSFRIAGTDRAVSLWALGSALDVASEVKVTPNYPNGCHIAEVEIDPETGIVTPCSYTAVDDCGNVLNHTLVEAQVRGGFAQGLGQVLFERAVYDPDTGQLLTGSFMDYGIPRADDLPEMHLGEHIVPCTTNPLGVKGVGEAGTTGALPTLMNAILDALAPLGVKELDMPATPERVWQAIAAARGSVS